MRTRRRARLSDVVCDLLASADPVSAFFEAHNSGRLVALRTSGTSATPRSVLRTTDSWVSSFAHVTSLLSMSARSRVWVPGPLSSTMNLFAAVHARSVGAQVSQRPEGVTHAHLTPSSLARVLGQGPDLGGRHVVVAGDRLPAALHDRARTAGIRVSHYYGAAELSFVAWGSHEADLRPFPQVEVVVREGALWVRSPFVCQGYDDRPGALTNGPLRFDGEGFVTVGDRGSFADGRLVVDGRGTSVVVTAGATVLVADVEGVLRPVVAGEVVVLGVPHQGLGEVVAAVLTDAHSLACARDVARSRLRQEQQPRLWFEVRDPPLTEAGKVDRAALRALLVSAGQGVRPLR